MKIQNIIRQIKANLSLGVLFAVMIITGLIAFPDTNIKISGKDYKFNGLDFTDLTRKKISHEFQFTPTLDFYGGSEVVYQIQDSDKKPSQAKANEAALALTRRLSRVGIEDYDLYVRDNANETQVVIKIPRNSEQLSNFNNFLSLKGDVSFAIAQQQDATDATTNTGQPNFAPVDIKTSDIKSISMNYGSETNGNGLVMHFKDKSIAKALITTWSDYNNDTNSRLFLQVDGQPVAAQTVALSSSSDNPAMFLTTGLGDDKLTTSLLENVITGEPLSVDLQLVSADAITGTYDEYIDALLASTVFGVVLFSLMFVYLFRDRGIISAINLVFIIVTTLAAGKILAFPISVVGLIAMLAALLIWILHINELLPFYKAATHSIFPTAAFNKAVSEKRRQYFNFLVISIVFLAIMEYTQIPQIHIFGLYFITTTFMGWLALLYALPTSITLLRKNQHAA